MFSLVLCCSVDVGWVWYVWNVDRRWQQQQQILRYSVAGVRHKERVQCLESLGSCWVQGSKFVTVLSIRSQQS